MTKLQNLFLDKRQFYISADLPSQLERFGPLRLYWDSNNEKFVYIPKNVVENLKRKKETYLKSKMTVLHKLNTIRYYRDK